jgi:hypothetical protein
LHEFLPLHEEVAVLHALVPLQELAPKHFTVVCADATDIRLPAANNAAAEAAKRRRLFILGSRERGGLGAILPPPGALGKSGLGDGT